MAAHARARSVGGRAKACGLTCRVTDTWQLDLESDVRVHAALLSLQCTVVEVAHRLHEIDRFDKAVVMEGGRVAEVGAPLVLLHDKSSRLASLVAKAEQGGDGVSDPQ